MKRVGAVVWLTGLSGAGKTVIASAVLAELRYRGVDAELLDGDEMRKSLCKDLGFSKEDRDENVRRVGGAAGELSAGGAVALVALVSPYRAARDAVRRRQERFIEVYVNAPVEVCESRDPKGLYRKARRGEIPMFTGVSDPYEPPLNPEVECFTDRETVVECAGKILLALERLVGLPQSQSIGALEIQL